MLRRRLILPAIGLALVLGFALTAVGVWAGNVIVSIMSDRLIREVTQAVHREVDHLARGTEGAVFRLADGLVRHDVPLGDPRAVARELYGSLTEEPGVDWLFFGNEAGGLVSVGRLADASSVFLMTDEFRAGVVREFEALPSGGIGRLTKSESTFDSRQKLWYTRAKETGKRYWTEPYLGAVEPILGVSLAAPVFNRDGNFVGVCGADLILTELSKVLQTLQIGDQGRAFIIDATGHLIAASGGVSPVAVGADGKELRLHAPDAADPIIREAARHLGRHPEIAGSPSPGPQVFSFADPERRTIYAAVHRFEAPGEIKWTIVSAVPASDFLGPVNRAAYISIVIGAVIVAAFIVVGLWTVRRTLRPLTELTHTAQAIAMGQWRDVPEFHRNDEVGLLAQAFNFMTARLKETLDGLRRSEASLEEAQRVAHVGYWERDLNTDRLTWSDESYRIFGLKPGKGMIPLAEVLERLHPEDRPIWSQVTAEALRGASRYDFEYRVVRPNGELRTVHSQGDLTRDASGQPRSMFGTIQDITERKRAEEALRESEEKWRTVFENNPTMYFMVDAAGTIQSVNPFGAEQLGYTVDELTGDSVLKVFHEADRAAAQRNTTECIERLGQTMTWELRKVRKDGSMLWVRETAKAMLIQDRPVVLIVCENITERKHAEYLTGQVFESSPDGISVVGTDYRYQRVNPVYERMWGIPAESVVGKHVADLLGPEAFEHTIKPHLDRCLRGEEVAYAEWFTNQLGRRYLVVTYSPLRPGLERVEAALVVTRDLTDHMVASEALREAQSELAHVNRVATMGQLTASIAHEVNQPITAAVTNAQAALRWLGADPPNLKEVRQALDEIAKSGNRAADVIGRIRALIKKTRPRKSRFDLNEAIRDVVALTRREVQRHGVSLQTELARGLAPAKGDRIQLQQVVLNLVMNAIEAMSDEEARELLISTETDASGGVRVAVRDTGPGLEPQNVDRVFDAFYTTKPEGMGMGLAICHSIIEAHGGRLWATANEPRGAVFQFTLPADRDETATIPAS